MKLRNRSYPTPVVGNADDVPGAGFQAVIECETDASTAYFQASIQCSSQTLSKMLDKGSASIRIHIECGATMFRTASRLEGLQGHAVVDIAKLKDDVEVVPFICAEKEVRKYRPEGLHSDYGDRSWTVRRGDVLAVGDMVRFSIEKKHDAIRKIGSIMQIQKAPFDDGPMEVDTTAEQKIIVRLAGRDFDLYHALKLNKAYEAQLTTAIVLPALMQAIQTIGEAEDGEHAPHWARVLRRRLEDAECGEADDLVVKAQKVLDMPIRRALAKAQQTAVND